MRSFYIHPEYLRRLFEQAYLIGRDNLPDHDAKLDVLVEDAKSCTWCPPPKVEVISTDDRAWENCGDG